MTKTVLRPFGAALALLLAAAFVLLAPGAARAHGGPIQLTIGPDGIGGVSLYAQYVRDGHMVNEIIDPLVTAKADDGRTAGPVSLVSSSEGQGRWVSEQPFLGEGRWTVTVRTTTPDVAETTAVFTVTELDEPISAQTTSAAVDDDASSALGVGIVGLGAGVLLVGGVVGAIVLRRRTKDRAV
ncbi:hypothetical protein [Microbacterium hatanonis]|jgi:hypothetical protein|uniref:Copper resistance protein CopC n=1 Tax=Microbacterium hatanonis TaxID=404366 RepID=A0A5C8HUE4_9MICO|nr:hypothetical protein [Microbacterium hatanonis]TXK09508.1 hypothetical protein FVP77_11315 [Microbacterium hatanonis]